MIWLIKSTFYAMNAPLPLAATAPSLAIERIRHPLQGRHLQVVRRTQVSPGFVRLTLAGPGLAGFVGGGVGVLEAVLTPLDAIGEGCFGRPADARRHGVTLTGWL